MINLLKTIITMCLFDIIILKNYDLITIRKFFLNNFLNDFFIKATVTKQEFSIMPFFYL
jgi:hypothetical protein